jgi:hypothetical protein
LDGKNESIPMAEFIMQSKFSLILKWYQIDM